MSSSTRKYHRFVKEPIGNRPVADLPGISDILATRMRAAGVDEASIVLGYYLVLNRDRRRFQCWMRDVFDAGEVHSLKCYSAIAKWYENFG